MYYLLRYKISSGEDTIIIVKRDKKTEQMRADIVEFIKGESTRRGFKIGEAIFFDKCDKVDQDKSLKKLKERIYINIL